MLSKPVTTPFRLSCYIANVLKLPHFWTSGIAFAQKMCFSIVVCVCVCVYVLCSGDIPLGADLVSTSLDGALERLQTPPLSHQIQQVFILGGRRLYQVLFKLNLSFKVESIIIDVSKLTLSLVKGPARLQGILINFHYGWEFQ